MKMASLEPLGIFQKFDSQKITRNHFCKLKEDSIASL
jgi:hypothetical protein